MHKTGRGSTFRRKQRADDYPSIDTDKISAKIDQGLVTLILAKAEHVQAPQDHCLVKNKNQDRRLFRRCRSTAIAFVLGECSRAS